jgi:hypothetical protein
LVLLTLFAVACVHDVHARFPAAPGAPTGRLVLAMSQPASGVTIAVNGRLVVEDKRTRKVIIDGMPAGSSEVVIAANGGDKMMRVWVDDSATTTVPLGVAEGSTALWKTILGTLISIAAYSLLR